MSTFDPRLIIDAIKVGYRAARGIPRITCDVLGVYKARWGPDYFHDEKGNVIAEGMEIDTRVSLRLNNVGAVDTQVKEIYLLLKSGKKLLGRLNPLHNPLSEGIIIKPRRFWEPKTIQFRGSLWDIHEPLKGMRGELIVEVVAQRHVKRKINLYL